MNSVSTVPTTNQSRPGVFRQLPPAVVLGVGVCLLIAILWSLLILPLQRTLEQRLQRYPNQLLSIQELNQTLVRYKDSDVRMAVLSDAEYAQLQQKLFSQGIKFTLLRSGNTNPSQIDLQIDEIEFSRWLALIAEFRQSYGLYVSGLTIKKNDGVGLVQISATLAQTR